MTFYKIRNSKRAMSVSHLKKETRINSGIGGWVEDVSSPRQKDVP